MSEYWVMEIIGTAHELWPEPQYLTLYDPEFADGRGHAEYAPSQANAMRFPSLEALLDTWKYVPSTRPVREDGRPNRPLTAFSISPKKVEP